MDTGAGGTRRKQLENHIEETLDLINQYEENLRLSSDPKEKAICKKVLVEQRGYLAEYQRELATIKQLGGEPSSVPEQGKVPGPQELFKCLEDKFRSQDLKKVYFLMGIGYDDLAGGDVGKAEKAMALIEYADKREQLSDLLAAMCQVYPGLMC